MQARRWQPDVLGTGYESTELSIGRKDEPGRVATLVRHLPEDQASMPGQAVLFIHGWSDYFFNTELAEFFTGLGIAFYALDLHNHGRSLRTGDLGGFVADLAEYDAELDASLSAVTEDLQARYRGTAPKVAFMGHSTGGLVAALWASRHPDTVSHLILNSPWLEMHGSSFVRHATHSMVEPFARWWPQSRIKLPERNFYWRSISASAEGEWQLDDALRPPLAFPIRFGWMSAILAGQSQVAKGLNIGVPILVLMSARSLNGPRWREGMRSADAVLDIQTMAARAITLGESVTIEKIDGGLHDVLLSQKPVRELAYSRLLRWLRGYMLEQGTGAPGRDDA
ncbi:MAG: alpha/beta hydrolase [Renibacterium salmoninarum]|nr:alpha/beta hydrolase [Renibacterium salmoninarum]